MKQILPLFLFLIITVAHPFTSFGALVIPDKSTSNPSHPDSLNLSYVLKNAIASFKNLSRSERRLKVKEAKKAIHEYKVAKRAKGEPSTNTLLLVILAILLPPLAVYLHEGETNGKFWLSLILTLLFFIPGLIYALIVVLDKS